jgi:uncharacterized protein YegL
MTENFETFSFGGESPENYEQKCLCVLVLDISGSMAGSPIDQLNQGLKDFQKELQNDFVAAQRIEVSIVTFGSTVETVVQPKLSADFEMPTLKTSGSTKLVDGVRMAINVAEERKNWYKSTGQTYYRPWVMLITDGEPDSDQDVVGLSSEIRNKVDNKGFSFYAVGVDGYNHSKLSQICHPLTPPLPLKGLAFNELFKWLSASISLVSKSVEGQQLHLPPAGGWAQIQV